MAKLKFEREEVVEKSQELFWHKGYSSSSMQDVIKATGLKPGSIYHTFGNKEALYGEALDYYTESRLEGMRKLIEGASSIGEGICLLLEDFLRQTTSEDYSGCFLIKTQFEITPEEGELHKQAVGGLEKVEDVLQEYLVREYGDELGRIRATSVMLHMNGIRVYGYRENGAERMLPALREGLPWLPWGMRKEND